jgi:hypothetical protein
MKIDLFDFNILYLFLLDPNILKLLLLDSNDFALSYELYLFEQ